ncbi:phosphate ABC transporter permease [Thermococci archaeon]|nr:MAG: phosphate ABC transporter permease [Thermococci archaeon]
MKFLFHNSLKGLLWFSAILTLAAVMALLLFLFKMGVPAISIEFFFGDTDPIKALFLQQRVFDGLFPAMVGTFLVVSLSVIWAIPLGLFIGIYLAEFCSPRVRKYLDFSFDLLAATPSIVIGLFGLTVAIFLHRHLSNQIYPCLLISSISLAVLILPYIVRTTQLSIETVPFSIRMTGLSLGASRLQNLFSAILPNALSGILSGIILALGRSAEDTAVIMLTGVVATAGIPRSVLAKFEALPFYIYYISSQYTDRNELLSGFGAALVLLIICGLLFISAHLIKTTVVRRINGL